MAIMTPENFLKDFNNSLISIVVFNEKITIATDNGNAILVNKENYDRLINNIEFNKCNSSTN